MELSYSNLKRQMCTHKIIVSCFRNMKSQGFPFTTDASEELSRDIATFFRLCNVDCPNNTTRDDYVRLIETKFLIEEQKAEEIGRQMLKIEKLRTHYEGMIHHIKNIISEEDRYSKKIELISALRPDLLPEYVSKNMEYEIAVAYGKTVLHFLTSDSCL